MAEEEWKKNFNPEYLVDINRQGAKSAKLSNFGNSTDCKNAISLRP